MSDSSLVFNNINQCPRCKAKRRCGFYRVKLKDHIRSGEKTIAWYFCGSGTYGIAYEPNKTFFESDFEAIGEYIPRDVFEDEKYLK